MILQILEVLRSEGFIFEPFTTSQDKKTPYYVYTPVSEVNDIGIDGKTHTKKYRYYLDIYTKNLKQGVEKTQKIEEILFENFNVLEYNKRCDYEDEYNLYAHNIEIRLIN